MAKIIGNTIATPMPRPDWNQNDKTKADFIKNKPDILTEEDVVKIVKENGGGGGGTTESLAPVATSGSFNDLKHKPSIVLSLNNEGVLCLNVVYSRDDEEAVVYNMSEDETGITITQADNATVNKNELEVI